jgi:hypothetical protein
MTDQHPITPPSELFKQWEGQPRSLAFEAAYRAGADMELEALLVWLRIHHFNGLASDLLEARRPKPLSLKEQLADAVKSGAIKASPHAANLLGRALEALPND